MKLHEAIKRLIGQFGNGVVAEVRLANLLADLNGYEEYPAMKSVFKDIQKEGFGQKVYECFCKNDDSVLSEIPAFIQQCADKTGYKEDLISYGFDSILYGLGVVKTVNEPLSKGYDPKAKDGDILDTMDEQLSGLQKQYLDLLDRLATQPKDILHDSPAYYSAEVENKLYAIEAKIAVLLQELGKPNDKDWCNGKKTEKLSEYKKQKEVAVKTLLDELKSKYSNLLASSIITPRRFFIKSSGYYDEEGQQSLSQVEEDIKSAYYNIGVAYDDWCEKTKNDYLAKHHVETSNVVVQVIGKIGIPAAMLVGASATGVSYTTSSDAIQRFEQTISLGEQKEAADQYGDAINLFNDARLQYDGSFRSGHYQSIANEHIVASVDKAVADCQKLIEQGKLKDASNILNSLPTKVITENAENVDKVNAARTMLDKVISEGLDNLISNISTNKGHLDATAKSQLNELLAINPNDYWLNFIKNKEQ